MTPEPMESTPPEERGWSAKAAAAPWVVSTYFAEGLPYSIVHQVSAQFFLFMGANLGAVTLTALYGLAWNVKLVWSPLIDLYGTTRRWLWVTEALVGLLIMAMAFPAGRGSLDVVAGVLVAVSFVAATHDIAIDGFFLRALRSESDQAGLSGLRVAAYRAALLFGSGALLALADKTSWRVSFLVAGGLLVGLAGVHAVLLPKVQAAQPRAEPGHPYRASLPKEEAAEARRRFIGAFWSYLEQPRVITVLAFILFYRAGDAMMFAVSSALMKSMGIGLTGLGGLSGVGNISMMTGALFGGVLIARWSLRRTLAPIALVQSLAILLYVVLAARRPGLPWIVTAVVLEQFIAGVGNAALMVFLMRRCKSEHKAAHFAIGTSLMSLAATTFGAGSGFLAVRVGFPAFFTLAFVASIPGVLLSRLVPKE